MYRPCRKEFIICNKYGYIFFDLFAVLSAISPAGIHIALPATLPRERCPAMGRYPARHLHAPRSYFDLYLPEFRRRQRLVHCAFGRNDPRLLRRKPRNRPPPPRAVRRRLTHWGGK